MNHAAPVPPGSHQVLTAFLGTLVGGGIWIVLALGLEVYIVPLLNTSGLSYGQSAIFHIPFAAVFGGIIGFVLANLRTRNVWPTVLLLATFSLIFGSLTAKWWLDDHESHPDAGELLAIYGPMAIMTSVTPTLAVLAAMLVSYNSAKKRDVTKP